MSDQVPIDVGSGADPLALLRGYHMPDPIDWWPPAPGWWLLLILTIGLGSAAGVLLAGSLPWPEAVAVVPAVSPFVSIATTIATRSTMPSPATAPARPQAYSCQNDRFPSACSAPAVNNRIEVGRARPN